MNTKVKELSIKELKTFIEKAVDIRLEERLGDPDIGLDIKPEVIKKIRKSRQCQVNIPAEDVAKRMGFKW